MVSSLFLSKIFNVWLKLFVPKFLVSLDEKSFTNQPVFTSQVPIWIWFKPVNMKILYLIASLVWISQVINLVAIAVLVASAHGVFDISDYIGGVNVTTGAAWLFITVLSTSVRGYSLKRSER